MHNSSYYQSGSTLIEFDEFNKCRQYNKLCMMTSFFSLLVASFIFLSNYFKILNLLSNSFSIIYLMSVKLYIILLFMWFE